MSTIKNKGLDISNPDFDSIKANLIDYLKGQEQFADYDFEASNISVILDVLAGGTFWSIFNANMAINESFLGSAKLRANVVSKAKPLGYTPKSASAPKAVVSFKILNPTGTASQISTVKGVTFFKANIDGKTYNFYATKTTTADRINNEFAFNDIEIKEGFYKYFYHYVDSQSSSYNIYELPDTGVDMSTLTVRVLEKGKTQWDTYYSAADSGSLDSTQYVYYTQEARSGKFEIYFGDNLIGNGPGNGAKVELFYLVTNKEAANGAGVFSLGTSIGTNTNIVFTNVQSASGGRDKEDIKSIKFNAPITYTTQNRAVTPNDYKVLIQNRYPDIQDISVWGGEENDPPEYGKVFISIKPFTGNALPQTEKDFITDSLLRNKSVVSIQSEIVDPEFTYIYLEALFKYNSNLTDNSIYVLGEKVRGAINQYNINELKRFDGVFRYSKLLAEIDAADPSIVSTTLRTYMEKRIVPDISVGATTYTIFYSSKLYNSSFKTIESSKFTYNGVENCFFEDYVKADGTRKIRIAVISVSSSTIETVIDDIGTIYPSERKIVITAFKPSSFFGDYIWIRVLPDSFDLAPRRNELLDILSDDANITGEVDTMAVGGTYAAVNYDLFPKTR